MEEEKLNMTKMKKTLSNWLFILVLLNNGTYLNTDYIRYIEGEYIYLMSWYYDITGRFIQVTPEDIENIKSAMGVFSKKL